MGVTFYSCHVQARSDAPPHARACAEWATEKGVWHFAGYDGKRSAPAFTHGPATLSDEEAAEAFAQCCEEVGVCWRPTVSDMSLTRAGKHPGYAARLARDEKAGAISGESPF